MVRLDVTPVVVTLFPVVVVPLPAADVTPDEAGPSPITRTPVKTVFVADPVSCCWPLEDRRVTWTVAMTVK
jgi:hypothetical protein